MSKILFVLFLTFFSFPAFSQNPLPPHAQGYLLVTSELQVRNIAKQNWYSASNTFDSSFYNLPDTFPSRTITYGYDTISGMYKNQVYKDTLLYANGKKTKYLQQQFDSSSQTWQNTIQYLFFYDAYGLLSSTTWQRWIDKDKSWRNIFQYNYYYKKSLTDSLLILRWDSTINTWKNQNLQTFTYDTLGHVTKSKVDDWDSLKLNWDSSLLLTYNYDNQHSLLKQYEYAYWDTTSLHYIPLNLTEYTYNNLNQLVYDTLSYLIGGILKTPYANNQYYYDAAGNQIEKLTLGNYLPDSSSGLRYFYKWKSIAALPVTLIYFKAAVQGGTTLLQWQSANERNSDHFNIERSSDGNHFSSIGILYSETGTNVGPKTYSFIDLKPASGINFYRLKQVDVDGNFTYSSICQVNYNAPDWKIIGNPISNSSVSLRLDRPANITIQILSVNGSLLKIIQKENLGAGSYVIPLNLENMSSGLYFVKLTFGNTVYTKSIIK